MPDSISQQVIDQCLEVADELAHEPTDGTWLQDVTVQAGPEIREWDVSECHSWREWPERLQHFPQSTGADTGIDVVARRRSDSGYIAIQCKSRQLDEHGVGSTIAKHEIDSFASNSAGDFWSERWIVTNGANSLTIPAE
ncbi:MAG: hypothetical protein OXD50_08545 [Chloroflexi bacterium]|nr:hypothetical protein [Chloroflexota bacterium]